MEGIIFGLSIAAPMGPISLICMQRTLRQGFLVGFISGLGTAAADAAYAILSSLSLGLFSSYLLNHSHEARLLGGWFLCFLGIKGMAAKNKPDRIQASSIGLFRAFLSNFLLTLSNPMTILTFLAVSTALGAVLISHSSVLVIGVFMGSSAWWFFFAGALHVLRDRMFAKYAGILDYLSNFILLGFGLYNIVSILINYF